MRAMRRTTATIITVVLAGAGLSCRSSAFAQAREAAADDDRAAAGAPGSRDARRRPGAAGCSSVGQARPADDGRHLRGGWRSEGAVLEVGV